MGPPSVSGIAFQHAVFDPHGLFYGRRPAAPRTTGNEV